MYCSAPRGNCSEVHERKSGEPSVSCIIPTLGRGKALCDTIPMLLRQSRSLHEIIIVDQSAQNDARTQRTLATWSHQGLIQWLRQAEPNASKARNAGALV